MDEVSLIVSILSFVVASAFSYVAHKASKASQIATERAIELANTANTLTAASNEMSKSSLALADASNRLSESQKTTALVSLLAPATEDPEQWRLFVKFLIKNNKLPALSDEDYDFVKYLERRLSIKASIVNGRLTVDEP
ncbi:hypothetical protein AWH61_19765 [Alteromonas sp. W12]|uniref:hypothetical protein n=1 Tax=Alteromonas sp. W12 TaxID=1772289 RepID=UPI0009489BB5|nr:hypothetical protein [Alteromonas sp. W12]OLF77537.1 hypothetical protein AWH61_19765 [Alteromonas sp. W12]